MQTGKRTEYEWRSWYVPKLHRTVKKWVKKNG
jgi:hypothetical protein